MDFLPFQPEPSFEPIHHKSFCLIFQGRCGAMCCLSHMMLSRLQRTTATRDGGICSWSLLGCVPRGIRLVTGLQRANQSPFSISSACLIVTSALASFPITSVKNSRVLRNSSGECFFTKSINNLVAFIFVYSANFPIE